MHCDCSFNHIPLLFELQTKNDFSLSVTPISHADQANTGDCHDLRPTTHAVLAPIVYFWATQPQTVGTGTGTGAYGSGHKGYVITVLGLLYLWRGTVARLRRSYRINSKGRSAASFDNSCIVSHSLHFVIPFAISNTTREVQ
jgi:hypothetical protein